MKSVYIKSSIIPLVIPNLLLFILISSEDFLKSRLGITKGRIMLDFRKSLLEININISRLGITKGIILDFI